MALLNFHSQFADAVHDGRKRMTIRAKRKRPIRIDEPLHLYTGCRTKRARRLLDAIPCLAALDIVICLKPLRNGQYKSLEVRLQHKGKLRREEIEQLARDDGHPSVECFQNWFLKDGITEFKGQLIKW